jgi:hypothetical protein
MSEDKMIVVSKDLENLLKNAGLIHRNLMIKEGADILRVKSPDNTLMMTAQLSAKMPGDLVIYDVIEFLSVLSLVDNPRMNMSDSNFVCITDESGEISINYQHADQRMITGYMDKDLVPDEVMVEFTMSNEKMSSAAKASSTLRLPNLAFLGDGEKVKLVALDSKLEEGTRGNTFSTTLGTTDKKFKAVFESEHLKMMPGDYVVKIAKKKGVLIALFVNKNQPVLYVMALSTNSEFTE